jgi:tungstate transport system permease protein
MDLIWQGIVKAFELVLGLNVEVWTITWLSVKISGLSTFISLFLGMPLGIALALMRFRGRSVAVALVNTGMGLPPVVVGLFVSIFLWRSGPLGFLELIYTPTAMIIAQVIIAFPIVAGLTMASFQTLDPKLSLQLLGIGASKPQLLWLLCKGGTVAPFGGGYGGIWGSHLRSRRFYDDRRQYPRADASAHYRNSFGDRKGKLRCRHCLGPDSASADLCH